MHPLTLTPTAYWTDCWRAQPDAPASINMNRTGRAVRHTDPRPGWDNPQAAMLVIGRTYGLNDPDLHVSRAVTQATLGRPGRLTDWRGRHHYGNHFDICDAAGIHLFTVYALITVGDNGDRRRRYNTDRWGVIIQIGRRAYAATGRTP